MLKHADIVSTEEAMTHLRLDEADSAWLGMAIPAVEHAIILWCGGEIAICDECEHPLAAVKMAALVELARLYIQREGPQQKNQMDWFMRGYSLGPGATALLQPLRKPTVA